jgi:hypothetical protein
MTGTVTGLRDVMRRRLRRTTVAAAIPLAVTATAFAYYTTTGSGGGSGVLTSQVDPAVVQVESDLNPVRFDRPGTSVEVYGRFVNKGGVPVAVEDLTAEVDVIEDDRGGRITDPEICGPADFAFADAEFTPPVEVPARSGTGNGVADWGGPGSGENLVITFVNDPDRNQDGCRGATVYFSYVANPAD